MYKSERHDTGTTGYHLVVTPRGGEWLQDSASHPNVYEKIESISVPMEFPRRALASHCLAAFLDVRDSPQRPRDGESFTIFL